jgi:hypothetical protein
MSMPARRMGRRSILRLVSWCARGSGRALRSLSRGCSGCLAGCVLAMRQARRGSGSIAPAAAAGVDVQVIAPGKTPRSPFVHVAIDDHSRLAYAEVLTDEKGLTAVGFLRRALEFFASRGIRVQRVMTYKVGPWARLSQQRRSHRSARALAQALQLHTTTRRPQPQAARFTADERSWELQLVTAPRGRGLTALLASREDVSAQCLSSIGSSHGTDAP